MTHHRPPRDGDLAMVKARRDRGKFDKPPTLARYHIVEEAEDGDPEVGYWTFFGSEYYAYPSDYDIHYYVTTTRLVGYAAL